MTLNKHGFGWRPDLPDQRDVRYTPKFSRVPAAVDLRPGMPSVYDQGDLGSCTANAVAAHLDFNRQKQSEPFIHPSRLFIYYNERVAEGTVRSDSGATIRESIKAVASFGAPTESLWPYVPTSFMTKPTAPVYAAGKQDEALQYQSVSRSLSSLQGCLADGYPFVIGVTVYSSFESIGSSGIMEMPAPTEEVLGGHALCVVGYKQISGRLYFIVRNSWGASWGDKGYFYMPSAYLLNDKLSSDFWTIRKVS